MGGEPLIRKDIGQIIDHAVGLGILTEMNSNGYLIPKRIEQIKNLDSICFSLDGEAEHNDALRGKGCHDKVIEAIELSLKHGLTVRLHGMMTNETLGSMEYLAEVARKYDVSFSCAPTCLPDLREKHPELYVQRDRAADFYRRYLAMKNAGRRIMNSRKAIRHVIEWPFPDKLIHHKGETWPKTAPPYVRCQFGHRSCYIDADGMMYACSWQWGLGMNYFEHGFDKCWQYLEDNLTCVTCNTVNDFSYAFDLDPGIIKEVIKDVLTR
jgi:MoaA/NifB/PqqE/SkfB family radical SAM enzyme